MKKIFSVLALFVISCAAMSAQNNPLGVPDSPTSLATTALTKHLLKATYVSNGFASALGSGFNNIDAVNNIVCPGTSGNCTVVADQVMQIGQNTTAGNRVALCFLIDGAYVSCPYNGDLPTNSHYATFGFSHVTTVSHGTHTVQTQAYTDNGATGAAYTFQYRVYKP